jgi:SAM-dependent methyltransferase
MEFEIQTVSDSELEQSRAKIYWGQRPFQYYITKQPWSDFIARRVIKFRPRTVFEFGCNAGKNIRAITEIDSGVFVAGIDVNRDAIEFGRANGLRLQTGDEHALKIIPDRSFDVTFTVSVIDHIANPEPVIAELARISRKVLLLLEPWLGAEGKVVRNLSSKGEMIDTTPFSYSWDYPRIVRSTLPEWHVQDEPCVLDSNLGRYYRLYTIRPDTIRPGLFGRVFRRLRR